MHTKRFKIDHQYQSLRRSKSTRRCSSPRMPLCPKATCHARRKAAAILFCGLVCTFLFLRRNGRRRCSRHRFVRSSRWIWARRYWPGNILVIICQRENLFSISCAVVRILKLDLFVAVAGNITVLWHLCNVSNIQRLTWKSIKGLVFPSQMQYLLSCKQHIDERALLNAV